MRLRKIGATFGIVGALVSGCALDAGGERIDDAEQGLLFSLTQRGRVGPEKFHVTQGGWVEVSVTGLHLNPAGCSKVKAAKLIVVRRGPPREDLPFRMIALDGKHKFETWNNLPAGDYEVAIDPIGEVPSCRWEGDVFVAAK
jgi:hypothetical protein